MNLWLKQSTAFTWKAGPFLDSTDGTTAETGLTISQADIRLSKNGGDYAQTNNVAGATHDENGYYDVPLDTTDTATLGKLRVAINETGALPVWETFMVVPANVWDSLFGADYLYVDTKEIASAAVSTSTAQVGANVVNWKGSAANAFSADYTSTEKAAIDLLDDASGGLADIHTDVAANATILTLVQKWIEDKLITTDNGDGTLTAVLYDTDSSTPLKTWVFTSATGTRAKAT
jgi:hypothetical protein